MTSAFDRVRTLLARILAPAAMERRVEPALADWSHEYFRAVTRGTRWRARWVLVSGAMNVLTVVGLVTLDRCVGALVHPDAATRAAMTTSLPIFVAVVSLATAVFAWLPFNTTPTLSAREPQDLLFLIPQALPLAIPLAIVAAIVIGLRSRLSGDVAIVVLTGALSCSVVSLATVAWLAPATNQAYRTHVLGWEPPKGDNELTLSEMRARIAAIRAFDPEAPARRLSVNYHVRWALSWTPLTLALFGLAVTRSARRAITRAVVSLLACAAWLLLLRTGAFVAYKGVLDPVLGAWLPNLAFICMASALLVRPGSDHRRLTA
jgi:hypothetical protein